MTNQNEYAVTWRVEGQTDVYADSAEVAGDLVQQMLGDDVEPLLSAAFGTVTNVVLQTRVTAAPAISSGLAHDRDEEFVAMWGRRSAIIRKTIEFINDLLDGNIPEPKDQLVINLGDVR